MGAEKFYDTSETDNLKSLEGYFDLIINTLSVEIDWNRYLNLLALDGTMVVVGIPEKETLLGASSLINPRRSLAGSVIGEYVRPKICLISVINITLQVILSLSQFKKSIKLTQGLLVVTFATDLL